mgnify:CR=1 FL=1|tara:strand:+ start:105 stop:455 length:351 start_codon:yes stop_codon:yes gene_type:complete
MGLVNLYDDSDAEDVARRVVSAAYTGSDWCEEGSIRKDILELNEVYSELESLVKRHRQDVIQLKKDIEGLRVTIQELVVVTKKHADKIDSTVVCIQTLNKMVEMISKQVGLKDESE